MTATPPPTTSPIFCRRCGYDLRAQTTQRCPECGRPFNPAIPRTFCRRPPRRWERPLRRLTYAVLALVICLAAAWLWCYRGWRDEQQALATLHARTVHTKSLFPWLTARLDITVLDRVESLSISSPDPSPPNLAPLAQLRHLNDIEVRANSVSDLAPLASCPTLRFVDLQKTSATNLAPLRSLPDLEGAVLPSAATDLSSLRGHPRLERLYLYHSHATDLSPLGTLRRLTSLDMFDSEPVDLRTLAPAATLTNLNLSGTPIRDVSPLASIPSLRVLILSGTNLSDARPLARIQTLRILELPATIPDSQLNDLRAALPACDIKRDLPF